MDNLGKLIAHVRAFLLSADTTELFPEHLALVKAVNEKFGITKLTDLPVSKVSQYRDAYAKARQEHCDDRADLPDHKARQYRGPADEVVSGGTPAPKPLKLERRDPEERIQELLSHISRLVSEKRDTDAKLSRLKRASDELYGWLEPLQNGSAGYEQQNAISEWVNASDTVHVKGEGLL